MLNIEILNQQQRKNIFYVPISLSKTYFHYWKSWKGQIENLHDFSQIVISDSYEVHGNFLGTQLRKKLKLDKKDNNNEKYLIVIPNEAYFYSKLLRRCFRKSRHLINKKYFFLDWAGYNILLSAIGRVQIMVYFLEK